MPVRQPVTRKVAGAASEAAASGEERSPERDPGMTGNQPVKRKAVSLGAAFDAAKPGGGFMAVGRHKAYITEIVLEEPNEKGHSAKVTYEGSDESEDESVHGKELSQWYKLLEKDGSPAQGLGFLKRDLEILGYTEVSGEELENVFAEITTNRPHVIINVKQNGQWTNAYLQGLVEESGE